jgi:tRNA-modifying protein YgfZ
VHGPRARDAVLAALGAGAADVPAAFAEDVATHGTFDDAPVIVVATSHADVAGYDLLCPRETQEPLWRRLVAGGARPMGHATLDVLRIEAGRPQWGAELGESTIPLEAGLRARAISETKGCYTGQEVIIRVLHRGHVNWQLRGVLLGDAAAPARDTPLTRGDAAKPVGRITSAAWSPKLGQAIAMAYVRREVEPPAELRLGAPDGPAVRVVELPFAGP